MTLNNQQPSPKILNQAAWSQFRALATGMELDPDDPWIGGYVSYEWTHARYFFEAYARDMSRRIAALAPKSVLETAAGSGAVTRAVAPILSPDASYVVTDLNQPMLDYAQTRQGADGRIVWQKADAQALPFGNASTTAAAPS